MTPISLTRLGGMTLCSSLLLSGGELARAADAADNPPAAQVNFYYDSELWQARGGIEDGGRYLDLATLDLTLDGGALMGVPSLSLYTSGLYSSGHVLNDELLGTLQGISNIETSRALRLYEAWAEWQATDVHSVKLGLYDLNSEFDAISSAALFINPSQGIGPDFSQTGRNGPSIFPSSSLALRTFSAFNGWVVQAAVLDAVPNDPDNEDHTTLRLSNEEGVLTVLEVGHSSETLRLAAGYWAYSARFDDLLATNSAGDPLQRRDNRGWYALSDLRVLPGNEGRGTLNVFARVGQANAHINPLGSYLGLGAVYSGVVPGKQDQLGLSLSIAHAGRPVRSVLASQQTRPAAQETIVELTYQLPVLSWLTVQPDVQYIRNAGLDADQASGFAFGVRFSMSTGWQR